MKQSITKRLWNLSYPTMLSFALQSFYDMVDMIWVGRINSSAVAGVTIFTGIYWMFEVFNEIIGTSSVSMISQSYGRRDKQKTLEISEQTISFKVLIALISAGLLLIFFDPLLHIYTKDPQVIQAARDYGYLRIFFFPVFFASFSVNTIFRCQEDAKTPMYIMGLCAILNLILDPIFIFDTVPFFGFSGLGYGVYGAALATVISISVSFLLGFFLLLKGHNGIYIRFKSLFHLNKEIDRELITIGIPNGLQMFFRFLFNAVMMRLVAVYGVASISGYGIAGKIYNMAFLPINGFMMGGSTLVGTFLGQEDPQHADQVAKVSSRMNASIMLVFLLISVVFRRQIMELFIKDPAVVEAGSIMLIASSLALPFLGYGFGCGVAFMGSGYNKPLLYSGFISQWLVQLPLALLVVYLLKLPQAYLFATFMAADLICFAILLYYYRLGEWKLKRV